MAGEHERLAEIRAAAEEMLVGAFSGPVRLDGGVPLRERDTIFRFAVLDGPGGAPPSVVVKGATPRDDQPYEPEAGEFMSQARRLFNDWAALEFLGQVMGDESPAPRL